MTFLLHTLVLTLVCVASCSGKATDLEEIQPVINCYSPFIELSGGCFYFHTTPMSWQDARNYCQAIDDDVDLATVSSCDQFSHIWQHILTTYGGLVGHWMGGSDKGQESNWHWVTGDSMPMGHPYWISGHPDISPEYDCLAYQHVSGYFVSWDCEAIDPFVCQQF